MYHQSDHRRRRSNPVTRCCARGSWSALANHTKLHTAKDEDPSLIDDGRPHLDNRSGGPHSGRGPRLPRYEQSDTPRRRPIRESTRVRRSAEAALREAEDGAPGAGSDRPIDGRCYIIGETLDGAHHELEIRLLSGSWASRPPKSSASPSPAALLPPDHFRGHEPNPGAYPSGRAHRPLRDPAARGTRRVIDVSLSISPIPRCRRHDHRAAEGLATPRYSLPQARRGGARAIAHRDQKATKPKGRSGQSHERRLPGDRFPTSCTPLNAIVGWAKILRSGKVDAEDGGGGPLGHRPEFPGPEPDH